MKYLTEINISDSLTILDFIVFFAVLLVTLLTVLYGRYLLTKDKSVKSDEDTLLDLLIMGRKLTLPMFVATMVATWYGGIFGVTRIAFEKGIFNFVTQGIFWYVSYAIFALFIVTKISKYNAVTLPDLITKMFGKKSGIVSSLFNFFNVLPITYVISLGLFISLLTGWSFILSMFAGVMVVIIYSILGGFRAVVFSDLVQFFVMCISVFLVLVFSVSSFGGLSFLTSSLPAHYFSVTSDVGIGTTLVWGFIALATLVDPNFYQRCFAAKSEKTAKKGIFISIIIWVMFDICTTAGAMYARAVIPEADSGSAYLTYAIQLLPSGFRGFFLAGILATILSTLDSYLFLAGTTVSYDIYGKFLGKRVKLFGHHLSVAVSGLLAVLLGTMFDGNIKVVWKTLGSYFASCLLLPVVIGHMFPGKISDNQFCFSVFGGVVGTTYWRVIERTGFYKDIDEIYVGATCTLLCLFSYKWFQSKFLGQK